MKQGNVCVHMHTIYIYNLATSHSNVRHIWNNKKWDCKIAKTILKRKISDRYKDGLDLELLHQYGKISMINVLLKYS